jgi:hypothetical protein
MLPESKITRRLLIRASELVKARTRLKIREPQNRDLFEIFAPDNLDIEPGGTVAITIQLLVPQGVSQNFQVVIALEFECQDVLTLL